MRVLCYLYALDVVVNDQDILRRGNVIASLGISSAFLSGVQLVQIKKGWPLMLERKPAAHRIIVS